ncbi:hypothetical protein MAM1_0343c09859 [Mucor ambiguus]|uniref:Uncharacterized protein n=1 Tax=Mucor ambiguus TaxID=91626 RepID=A0A0C9MHU0_9FUNG|nr:hypothetical protein MAM1_0343c09859 [Mucor ambiguus]
MDQLILVIHHSQPKMYILNKKNSDQPIPTQDLPIDPRLMLIATGSTTIVHGINLGIIAAGSGVANSIHSLFQTFNRSQVISDDQKVPHPKDKGQPFSSTVNMVNAAVMSHQERKQRKSSESADPRSQEASLNLDLTSRAILVEALSPTTSNWLLVLMTRPCLLMLFLFSPHNQTGPCQERPRKKDPRCCRLLKCDMPMKAHHRRYSTQLRSEWRKEQCSHSLLHSGSLHTTKKSKASSDESSSHSLFKVHLFPNISCLPDRDEGRIPT